ncbi:hypothetical protein M758_11G139900 [Ceratodon purpureus]|nr:hypothetical protein M758_11G139900 [Ceratodon purpureus]
MLLSEYNFKSALPKFDPAGFSAVCPTTDSLSTLPERTCRGTCGSAGVLVLVLSVTIAELASILHLRRFGQEQAQGGVADGVSLSSHVGYSEDTSLYV